MYIKNLVHSILGYFSLSLSKLVNKEDISMQF